MTNAERIQARIARSRAKREEKRRARAEKYGHVEQVITNQTMFRSMMKRKKNTDWKQSVQDYVSHGIVRNKRQVDAIQSGENPEPGKIQEIYLYERGKRRRIHAVAIDSRVVQGALCDNCITPLTEPGLIYDNPASTKGKGVSWARERLDYLIRKQLRNHPEEDHAMVYDLHGFFDSIRHKLCEHTFRRLYMDNRLIELSMHFIKMYQMYDAKRIACLAERESTIRMLQENQGIGVSLGSQISQDMARAAPNQLDHTIKDKASVKAYMRYMDDGYMQGTKEHLQQVERMARSACEELGLEINERKTRIVKLSHGFQYLKINYMVTATGRIVKRMARSGIVRMRRKLKRLRRLVSAGRATLDDALTAVKSWLGNAKRYSKSYRSRKSILNLYHKLFHSYRMEGVIA